jgi:hypothetical protein
MSTRISRTLTMKLISFDGGVISIFLPDKLRGVSMQAFHAWGELVVA